MFRRRWKSLALTFVVAAVGFYAMVTLTEVQQYEASVELLFKEVWRQTSHPKWVAPLSNRARANLMTGDQVMSLLRKDLADGGLDLPVEDLAKMIHVEIQEAADTLLLRVVSENPETALSVRDQFVKTYRRFELQEMLEKLNLAIREAEASEREVEEQLKEVEAELQEFVREQLDAQGIVDVETQSGIVAGRLVRLEGERQDVRIGIRRLGHEMEDRKRELRGALSRSLLEALFGGFSSAARRESERKLADPALVERLDRLEEERTAQLKTWMPKHPQVEKLDVQIRRLKEEIARSAVVHPREQVARLEETRRQEEARESMLAVLLEEEYGNLRALNLGKEQMRVFRERIGNLNRSKRGLMEERDALNRRLSADQYEIERAVRTVRKSDRAVEVPLRRTSFLLIGAVALMIAAGVCISLETMDPKIWDEYDLDRHSNLPILSSVPYLTEKPGRLLVDVAVKSPLSELFAGIAIPLVNILSQKQAKVLMVTSARKGEGKTMLCTNLAVALARAGYRVILLDADLRKATIHKFFGLENDLGLSQILQGELEQRGQLVEALRKRGADEAMPPSDAAGCLQDTAVPNLRVLVSGTVPPSPVECLNSAHLTTTINELRNEADFVLVDSPPLLTVVDGAILAQDCDLSLLVTAAGVAEKRDIRGVKRIMGQVRAEICGVILNMARQAGRTSYKRRNGKYRRDRVYAIPLEKIHKNPYQPRRVFQKDAMDGLKASIRACGVIVPVILRPTAGDAFELVSGERRWRACRDLGLREIPALVRHLDDEATVELSLVENLVRRDLGGFEEAAAVERLKSEFTNRSTDGVAARIGITSEEARRYEKLHGCPGILKQAVHTELISQDHAVL
ncbi:MAG: ParB/RepB/Spo0J family partition protein, partial [Planctomycetota bacterium]